MKRKHTPGPWYLDATDDSIFVLNDLSDIVAIINREVVGIENCEADADLIAAAPELLEALEMILQMLEEQGRDACRGFGEFSRSDFEAQPQIKQILSAIAKARGES